MTIEASGKLKELMSIINVYVDGLVGRNNPDYEDICQDAYIDGMYYLVMMPNYSASYIFKTRVKKNINTNVENNYHKSMEDYIIDKNVFYTMTDIVTNSLLKDSLSQLLQSLTPKEEEVLVKRFCEDKTLDRTARELNVTPERVRQIEAKALRKLRHPMRSKLVYGYLKDIDSRGYKEIDDIDEDLDNEDSED